MYVSLIYIHARTRNRREGGGDKFFFTKRLVVGQSVGESIFLIERRNGQLSIYFLNKPLFCVPDFKDALFL